MEEEVKRLAQEGLGMAYWFQVSKIVLVLSSNSQLSSSSKRQVPIYSSFFLIALLFGDKDIKLQELT